MSKGGGDSKITHKNQIDKEYNARLAAIAERELEMSEEMWNLYQDIQVPYEKAQTKALTELLPSQQIYEQSQLDMYNNLMEKQETFLETQYDTNTAGLGLQGDWYASMRDRQLPQQLVDTQSQFLQSARDGIDIQGRMGMAQADVTKGFQGALGQQRLADSRMGLDPRSGASQARAQDLAINQAGAIAGARTQARGLAEQEQFQGLQSAAGMGLGMGG